MKDKRVPKDIVEEIYKKISVIDRKMFIIGFCTFMGLMILISLILGEPLPQREPVIFTSNLTNGWIFEYPVLFFSVVFFDFCVILGCEIKEIYKAFKPLKDMILEECNPLKVISFTERAIEFPVKKRYLKKVAVPQFEQLHVEALNAAGEFNAALTYLNEQWRSSKNNYYKTMLAQIQLNIAVVHKNKEQYLMLFEHAPKSLKNNLIIQTQKCIVEENYEQGIEMLNKVKYKFLVHKVQLMYFYGKCYFEMQDYGQAEKYLNYVVENGNTLVYRKESVEMLANIHM